ncbi:MAG TPA: hypothetical protein VI386_10565, partial [Candidatus Sulfotelmatobacter sp.]
MSICLLAVLPAAQVFSLLISGACMQSFKKSQLLSAACALSLVLCSSLLLSQTALSPSDVVEHGKFRLHKFEQPIGEETYQTSRDGDSLVTKIDFKFTDRGSDVPLAVTFRSAQDLTPQVFEIKGKTARSAEIDQTVEVQKNKVRLRNRTQWTDAAVPPPAFFTIAGYAPATMQMLLVRYWATHGSPLDLPALPAAHIKIEPRGQDSIVVNGKSETLDRYIVEGLIWGRESLWFDGNRNLVALISLDAEFDHFEAIHDGYENALGMFVARAGADGMAALASLSKKVSAGDNTMIAIVGGNLIDGTGNVVV